jgi:hypothetical protein
MEVRGQLLAPATLPPEKDSPVQANWAPDLHWTLCRRGNIFILPETDFMPSSPHHIAIPTELSSPKCFYCNIKHYEGTGGLITMAWLVIELDETVPDVNDNFEYVE